jgi:hypothetical protein
VAVDNPIILLECSLCVGVGSSRKPSRSFLEPLGSFWEASGSSGELLEALGTLRPPYKETKRGKLFFSNKKHRLKLSRLFEKK